MGKYFRDETMAKWVEEGIPLHNEIISATGDTGKSQELYRSPEEDAIRKDFVQHLHDCPVPEVDLLQNLGLFLSSKNLSRILFFDQLYQLIVTLPGVIIEFGCRWGQNIAVLAALRGIYEPFNRHRKILGFDTFEGLRNVTDRDNTSQPVIHEGSLSVTPGYEDYLAKTLGFIEADNPMSHLKRFELIKGDAGVEAGNYLLSNPETIIAFAFFDMDLYQPTKECLEAIMPHTIRGTVIAFDELNDSDCPGETLALQEVLGLNRVALRRWPYCSRTSFFVVD